MSRCPNVAMSHYYQQMNWHFGCLYQGRGSTIRQKIRIDVKSVLPRSEKLHRFHSTHGTLRPQGWRIHYTHAAAEASYDRVWSLALELNRPTLLYSFTLGLKLPCSTHHFHRLLVSTRRLSWTLIHSSGFLLLIGFIF